MATKSERPRLYIAEWMATRGFDDQDLAQRVRVDRVTVTRWRTHQHRLNLDKITAIAAALGIEPEELWRPPTRPSVDAMLKDASDDARHMVAEVVSAILRTGNVTETKG